MNETHLLTATEVENDPATRGEAIGWVGDLMLLTKARLTFLVIVTTFMGYLMASRDPFDWARFLHTVVGTSLVAAAAAAFNQVIEMNVDRLMERTRNRPLPAGRMTRATAFWLGVGMTVLGLAELLFFTNYVATYLAAASLVIYVAFYTPMKRRTSFCVTIGAVSGAIPPLIGWTAVDGSVGLGGWVLFGILFAWQMPHFLAIAWMYRDEYSQAGFVMLPRKDRCGIRTAVQSLLYSVALSAITLVPFFAGEAGGVYLAGALFFDLVLLACAAAFLVYRTRASARALFFSSILYLPALLGLMVLTRL